jgi:hypothetical protein
MKTLIEPFVIAQSLLYDYNHALPQDVKNKVSGALRARDLRCITSCSDFVDAAQHPSAFVALRQIEALFKKNTSFKATDYEHTTLSSFIKGEELCFETNQRLNLNTFNCSAVKRMRKFIRRVLGCHSDFLNELPELVKVTNGATRSMPRSKSHAHRKVAIDGECTPRAYKYIKALGRYFGIDSFDPKIVSTNRVTVVPKNWKTGRTIACEPVHNVPVQLAVDSYLKQRLLRFDVNLRDQSINQELARRGSIDGSYATIDLEMASDSLALATVQMLLPDDWYAFFEAFRSAAYEFPSGYRGVYHKFSSMGNGYTFALESLIFASVCYATGSNSWNVYGDDIIIDTPNANHCIALLRLIGFKVNHNKTFLAGPFRESCGADWLNGNFVTPFYLREAVVHNWTLAHLVNGMVLSQSVFGRTGQLLLEKAVSCNVLFVPYDGNSLSGVWIHPNAAYQSGILKKKKNRRNCSSALFCKRYVPVNKTRKVPWHSGALLLWYFSRNGGVRSDVWRKTPLLISFMLQGRMDSIKTELKDLFSSEVETSSFPVGHHGYRKRQMRWHMPSHEVPASCYDVGSYLTALWAER